MFQGIRNVNVNVNAVTRPYRPATAYDCRHGTCGKCVKGGCYLGATECSYAHICLTCGAGLHDCLPHTRCGQGSAPAVVRVVMKHRDELGSDGELVCDASVVEDKWDLDTFAGKLLAPFGIEALDASMLPHAHFGFLYFEKQEEADDAIQLINGRRLKVRMHTC